MIVVPILPLLLLMSPFMDDLPYLQHDKRNGKSRRYPVIKHKFVDV